MSYAYTCINLSTVRRPTHIETPSARKEANSFSLVQLVSLFKRLSRTLRDLCIDRGKLSR